MEENRVYPGIHKSAHLRGLSENERTIVNKISKEWYVTHGGEEVNIGGSFYRYILIKPTYNYQEMFNLERELVVIFNRYENFEPRTLEVFDHIMGKHSSLRLDKICSVIVSNDKSTGTKINDYLRSNLESQILVSFTYDELLSPFDSFFMRNRFKQCFYSRDLFAFQAPLRKDIYFFGRNDIIHSFVNRQKSNENSGLFGLRKTGKTSVIYGIERALALTDGKALRIDCQSPAFHRRRWNKALYYIISLFINDHNLKIKLEEEEKYTEEDAPILFERDLLKIHNALEGKNILLIFDEIENITFNISPTDHWATGLDFIFFWQTLRSIFQKIDMFSYLIVGTNAMCVEVASIKGKDNPIFNQIPVEYISNFDVPQTREMVRKLGRLMGLKFDEIIYGKLTEDFGGHPFLIRQVCSVINNLCSSERPVTIDKALYEKAKQVFNQKNSTYIEMILNVLNEFYADEYSMLEYLSTDDLTTFQDFANISPYYTNHLLGYGIIEKPGDTYNFKIESVKEYLLKKNRYKKISMTPEEMIKEVSERRNTLEPKLRLIIRNQLRAIQGKALAKESILNIFGGIRKSELTGLSYEDLFNPNKSEIYFDDLRKIIVKNWDYFKNIFSKDKNDFDMKMQFINKHRADAHAKKITKEEMNYFRLVIGDLEKQVEEFSN
jgi:hypothetical protein